MVFFRFRLHSIILIIEIIEVLLEKFTIKNIVVSGFKEKNALSSKTKICSEINTISLSRFSISNSKQNKRRERLSNTRIFLSKKKSKKKKICISNGGYNFKRVINFLKKIITIYIFQILKKYLFLIRLIIF